MSLMDVIEEIRAELKTVVRKGELKKKVVCPEGYWYDPAKGKCVKVTAAMLLKKKRIIKKALRTRKRNAAKNRISIKKSLRKTRRVRRAKKALLKRKKIISA